MSFFEALITEGRAAFTLWTSIALVVVIVLSRALRSAQNARLPGTIGFFALHLTLIVVTAALSALDRGGAEEARIAARVLGAMTWVGVGGAAVFGIALAHSRVRVARILQDLIVALVTVVVVVAVLSRLGVSLSGLFATSAVATAVIGLSLQDTLGNTIGGLALQADGSVKVGDWIKVGDQTGRVAEIRWRYTAIETRNWETVLVPNSVLMKGPVTVLGRRQSEPEQWRRWVWFNVDFRYPPSEVIEVVVKALTQHTIEHVARTPPPSCVLMDLTESYGRYAVRYHLTNFVVDDPTDSLVRTRIMFALKRAGIPLSIPAHAIFMTEESRKRKEAKSERELQKRVAALHTVDLFDPLDEEELKHLAAELHAAPFTKGEVITKQGAEGHWLYLIMDGEIAVRVAKDGVDVEVARMGEGTFFGEMSLMTGEPRSATVVALTDVDCWRLDKEAFQDLLKRRPEVARPMAELLAERRANRRAIEEGLSAEARAKAKKDDENDLLTRMKSFFGLE